ncbi:MAG TPA: hypothetical protein GX699_09530, partial [Firmicutes bacterium]|nr:hypothetical protein [Bacillota bacterium]
RSETFYVSINGEEPRAFSPAEPVILEGLEVGSTYTIEEVGLAPDSAYVCLTEPVTVTVGPFAEYVVITNQYQDSDFVVPPDTPETGGEDDEQDVIVEPELPRTDSMGIYLLLLGLILVIVGFRLQAGTRKS